MKLIKKRIITECKYDYVSPTEQQAHEIMFPEENILFIRTDYSREADTFEAE